MQRDRVIPAVLGFVMGGLVGAYVASRSEVVTYTSFRLDPVVIESGQKATLYMSVAWLKTGCDVTIQQNVWSIDGTQTYSVDGPYIAMMKDANRVLIDKPRPIVMPALPPGEYETGFSRVDAKCWPWEVRQFAISNTPPKRFRFTVR